MNSHFKKLMINMPTRKSSKILRGWALSSNYSPEICKMITSIEAPRENFFFIPKPAILKVNVIQSLRLLANIEQSYFNEFEMAQFPI